MGVDYYSLEYLIVSHEDIKKKKYLGRNGHYFWTTDDEENGLPEDEFKLLYENGKWLIGSQDKIEEYEEYIKSMGFKMEDPIIVKRMTIYEMRL